MKSSCLLLRYHLLVVGRYRGDGPLFPYIFHLNQPLSMIGLSYTGIHEIQRAASRHALLQCMTQSV